MSAARSGRRPRRVGVLGGTFDPPHLGHLVVAESARVDLGLDEVRLVPAGDPWMKATVAASEHRLAMTRIAVADDEHLRVDDREIARQGPTYTVETLHELAADHAGAQLVFLLGADAAARLDEWERIDEALGLAEFVVVSRPGHRLDACGDLSHLQVPAIDVSSTDLRRRVAGGRAVRYLTPAPVERYIAAHDLYGGDAAR